jgi:hypothetical protein
MAVEVDCRCDMLSLGPTVSARLNWSTLHKICWWYGGAVDCAWRRTEATAHEAGSSVKQNLVRERRRGVLAVEMYKGNGLTRTCPADAQNGQKGVLERKDCGSAAMKCGDDASEASVEHGEALTDLLPRF